MGHAVHGMGGILRKNKVRWAPLPRLRGRVAEGRERASFHAERSDADFFAVERGFFAVERGQTSPSFVPLFNQRRCAPDGTTPSPALRAPSPAKRGRGIHRKNSALRKPPPRHCEGRRPAAIQTALQIAVASRKVEPPRGLPRRFAPRNDEEERLSRRRVPRSDGPLPFPHGMTISQSPPLAVPSPACGRGCPVRGGRGLRSMRRAAPLIKEGERK
jgi:hypothetical protein